MIAKSTIYGRNRDAAMRARGLEYVQVYVPAELVDKLKADAAARDQTIGETFVVLAEKWLEEF